VFAGKKPIKSGIESNMNQQPENQSKFSFINPKPEINPIENKCFAGCIIQTTPSEFERIKKFILEETNARLIYQTRNDRYIQIVPATPTTPEQ